MASAALLSVVGRMDMMLVALSRQPKYRGLIPFLQTYYLVTKAVTAAGMQRRTFYDQPAALERLDSVFADLYFKPLERWLAGQRRQPAPWKTYYTYCQSGHGNAFVELLLGINAHINGDLPLALNTARYRAAKDFNRIDALLLSVIPEVMQFLTKHYHDYLSVGAFLLPSLTEQEFHHIIVRWRHQAWDNAQQINANNLSAARKKLHTQTEAVAKQLVEIFSSPQQLVRRRAELETLRVVL
ncbi:MAG: hypothetical protein HY565_03285 [Candidatus Kerfeldbacteria bacterium]|nr:hypothetical protein [Candidatus Kerfeldbacteria bacterium]